MSAEWVLTEESEAALAEFDRQVWTAPGSYAHVRFAADLAAIERAAVARALTVDNVARELRSLAHPVDGYLAVSSEPKAGEWDMGELAAVLIVALTEDVP